MKILVLGGAGDMGSNIVRFLIENKYFDEVHIGDINKEKADALISELGEKCKYVKLDARNYDELVEVFKNYEIVVSALGPFYEFGAPVVKAAIKAGVDFLDICDDYDATKQILEMHYEAKNRNVCVITGIGWTPGLSNLLVKYSYLKLNNVNNVKIFWAGSAADSKGLAVIMHLLYAITGKVPMFINGEEKFVNAGTCKEEVFYPEPIRKAYGYYTGHPEPITLPKYLKNIKNVEIKGGLIPDWQNYLGKFFVKIRLTNKPSRRRRLSKFLHKIEGIFRKGGIECSAVRVDVYSNEEKLVLGAADKMGRLTGIPAAVTAELLAKGEVNEVGCYAPEGCESSMKILKLINLRGIKVFELKEEKWKEITL